jgi:hypothetical protein
VSSATRLPPPILFLLLPTNTISNSSRAWEEGSDTTASLSSRHTICKLTTYINSSSSSITVVSLEVHRSWWSG